MFAATSAASFIVGPALLFLLLPVTAFGLITNRIFKKLMSTSAEQARQAERHVEELSHYLNEQKRVAMILQESEARFRNAFDHAGVGMALVSMSGTILKVNRALAELLGFTDGELLLTNFVARLPEEDKDAYKRELTKLFYGAVQTTQIEQQITRKDGEILWVLWSGSLIPADSTEPAHYVFQFQDITNKKRAEQRLAHDALHDSLTALPNRILFLDRLQVAFRRAHRGFDSKFAVCYLDFDRFKLVNDSFGHTVGDQLLVEFAERIKLALRGSDTVARLGGDEFAVLIEEISCLEDALPTLERIRDEVSRPFVLEDRRVFSTVSIGIAPWSRTYDRPETLLRDADTALYRAKRGGRDRIEVFSAEMHHEAFRFLQNESDLRHALENNEFRAFYQPIVDIKSGELSGFEALVRWESPDRGLVPPSEFIPVAEETGLIFPIGEWMLRESCDQLAAWQRSNDKASDLWVSVNVSAKQFMQVDVAAIVAGILEDTGLAPGSLKLELTESAMVDNIEHVAEVMTRLKALGVKLSIDDFGTGYSSLSSLHKLPLDSLKIDQSFVNHMGTSAENMEIVKTIIALAHSLGLDVIAEGVETANQVKQLRKLRCKLGQGFFFAPPLEAEIAESLFDFPLIPSDPRAAYLPLQDITETGQRTAA